LWQTKRYADIIIPRGGENLVAIDLLVQHIKRQLRKRGVQQPSTPSTLQHTQPSYYISARPPSPPQPQQAAITAAADRPQSNGVVNSNGESDEKHSNSAATAAAAAAAR
jgi:hypothetical protein